MTHLRTIGLLLLPVFGCGGLAPVPGPPRPVDAGVADAGPGDAGVDDGWRFVPVAGSRCARGAQTGFGYNAGSTRELVIFLQGGGACWNTGTCQPSLQQWGPICNYGSNAPCLWDAAGGTRPLAAFVDAVDPFPADGGGAFPSELATVRQSLLFARRVENPLRDASWVFVPYCTGDLHSGDATATYPVKTDAFGPVSQRTHHFAGAKNLDLFLEALRAQHPQVDTVWLLGVSAGGFGVSAQQHRVRSAFPEATVHVLADSAPMITSAHWAAWRSAWNFQFPPGCASCDAGLPEVIAHQLDTAPTDSRIGFLAFDEDEVLTRFFFAGGSTDAWLNPPFGAYRTALADVQATFDTAPRGAYFMRPGREHVMLFGYGLVQPDGGLTQPLRSRDGGMSVKDWVDAWATGQGDWATQR